MTYHEAFWATSATVAAAILVATAVALGQSVDTMVERVRERRMHNEPVGSRRWTRARQKSLALSYVYALGSIVFTLVALFLAMVCLLNDSDVVPPWLGIVALFIGIGLIFFQVFASADAKLAEVRAIPQNEGSDDLT